jgi:tetratricopeptide (TPR) repeat protein
MTQRPAIYLLAAALLGSLLSVPRPARSGLHRLARASMTLLLVLAFVVGDLAPYLAWRIADRLPRGRLDGEDAVRLTRALRHNPVHPDLWLRRAEHLAGDGTGLTAESYAAAREATERAIRLSPGDARYRRGAARIEALACRSLFRDAATRARAAERFREAERLSRYDPFIALELAGFLMDTDDPAGARRAAERALALEPEAVVPRLLLADALLSSGATDPSKVERLLDEAVAKSDRWRAHLDDGLYAGELLRLDTTRLDRLRERASGSARPAGS